ncbi:hypothetical protein GCM10027271_01520 [Saccharopolyspora gloriosae]
MDIGRRLALRGTDFARPEPVPASATWAAGPTDGKWHCVEQDRFGFLRCWCGHDVRGPVHLRRFKPLDGSRGRTICAAGEAEIASAAAPNRLSPGRLHWDECRASSTWTHRRQGVRSRGFAGVFAGYG